jgi:hypothetical protein
MSELGPRQRPVFQDIADDAVLRMCLIDSLFRDGVFDKAKLQRVHW